MSLKEYSKKFIEDVAFWGYLGIIYTGITVGIGAVTLGGQYLTEKISNKISPSEKKELVLKLKKKKELLLPRTHARIDAGTFETLEGKIINLTDLNRVSEGKMWPNEYIYGMKIDSTYKVEVTGNENLGYIILGVNNAKAGETR